MKSLSLIVPFYNEIRTLPTLVKELQFLSKNVEFQVVFVDDGSTDGSVASLKEKLKGVSFAFEVLSQSNGGKASAVHYGIHSAKGSHCLVLDADLELSPKDIPNLWEIVLQEKSEFVFGYRTFLSHSSFTWRYAKGNRMLSNFFGLLFNVVITDIMCGFKLLPTDYLKKIPFSARGFAMEVQIPFEMWKDSKRPYEVAVQYLPRTRMEGKTIGLKDAVQVLLLLVGWRLRFAIFKK